MSIRRSFILAGVATMLALPAAAATLNFESEGYVGNSVSLGNDEAYAGADVTFSSANGLFAVKTGGPADGFVPNDNPLPVGVFGDYFLTSDFGTTTAMSISYGTAVSAASFDVADIDGTGSNTEEFTFKAFFGALEVGSIAVNSGDPGTGDRLAYSIGFSNLGSLFDRIEIVGTTAGGTRHIGIAFDNFNTTVDVTTVPLPAAAWMLLAGIGGLGALGRRSRKQPVS